MLPHCWPGLPSLPLIPCTNWLLQEPSFQAVSQMLSILRSSSFCRAVQVTIIYIGFFLSSPLAWWWVENMSVVINPSLSPLKIGLHCNERCDCSSGRHTCVSFNLSSILALQAVKAHPRTSVCIHVAKPMLKPAPQYLNQQTQIPEELLRGQGGMPQK